MKVTGDKLIRSYIITTIFVTNLCFLSFFCTSSSLLCFITVPYKKWGRGGGTSAKLIFPSPTLVTAKKLISPGSSGQHSQFLMYRSKLPKILQLCFWFRFGVSCLV